VNITEITGMEGEVITLQDIFEFKQKGVDASGKIVGEFRATGVRPRCLERIARAGASVGTGFGT
jgi:pilus assembly protein CpaF